VRDRGGPSGSGFARIAPELRQKHAIGGGIRCASIAAPLLPRHATWCVFSADHVDDSIELCLLYSLRL
jgi:hypothetical protein